MRHRLALLALLSASPALGAPATTLIYDTEEGLFLRNWTRLFFEVEPGRISTLEGFDGGANITNTNDYTQMYFIGGVPLKLDFGGHVMISWGIHWLFQKYVEDFLPAMLLQGDGTSAQALRGVFALMAANPGDLPFRLQIGGYIKYVGHGLDAASPRLIERPYLSGYLAHDQDEVSGGAFFHFQVDTKNVIANVLYRGADVFGRPLYLSPEVMFRFDHFALGPYVLVRDSEDEIDASLRVGARGGYRDENFAVDLYLDNTANAASGAQRWSDVKDAFFGFEGMRVKAAARLETDLSPLLSVWYSGLYGAGFGLGARLTLQRDVKTGNSLYMDLVFTYNEPEIDPLLGRSDGPKIMFDFAI